MPHRRLQGHSKRVRNLCAGLSAPGASAPDMVSVYGWPLMFNSLLSGARSLVVKLSPSQLRLVSVSDTPVATPTAAPDSCPAIVRFDPLPPIFCRLIVDAVPRQLLVSVLPKPPRESRVELRQTNVLALHEDCVNIPSWRSTLWQSALASFPKASSDRCCFERWPNGCAPLWCVDPCEADLVPQAACVH
jgi:hypothetical protein